MVAISAVVLRLLRAGPARTFATYAVVAVTPAALGAVVLNRYDLWPALIMVAALAAVIDGRDRLGFGLLALGVAVKIYPAVALPLILIHVARTRGREAVVRAVASFAIVFAICVAPFALIAPGGLGYSVKTQTVRHLQLESLPASILLAADKVGAYSASIVPGKPGSLDLGGTLPNALGVLTTLLLVAALAAVFLTYWHADENVETLILGVAASVAAFIAFSKVISPQFLVWLIPLIPLVARRVGLLRIGTPGLSDGRDSGRGRLRASVARVRVAGVGAALPKRSARRSLRRVARRVAVAARDRSLSKAGDRRDDLRQVLELREAVVGAFQLQHVVRELPRERPVPAPVGGAADEQRGSSAPPQHRHDVVVPQERRQPHGRPATVGGRARGQRRERLADHEELLRLAGVRDRRVERGRSPTATPSCERSRNWSQTRTARQPRLSTPSIAKALTGMPASIAPGRTIAVRSGSPAYS